MTTLGSNSVTLTHLTRPSVDEQGIRVRPVSQVLLSCTTIHPESVARMTRRTVLRWIQEKAGRNLPSAAWEGAPFNLDYVGAQRAEGTRSDRYWATRADDQDKSVAGRTWVTQVTIATEDDAVHFGTRLFVASRGEQVPFTRTVPNLVRRVATSSEAEFCVDGRSVRTTPWVIASADDVESFIDFLVDPSRRLPVCVLSLPEWSTDLTDAVLPVLSIIRRTVGIAHVAVLTGPASLMLADRIGKFWAVFHRAVRTYWPGIDLEVSDPYQHLLSTAMKIENWEGGPAGFADLLVDSLIRSVVSYRYVENTLPTYSKVRQMRREQLRAMESASGVSNDQLLESAFQENDELRAQLDEQANEFEGVVSATEEERDQALSERDEKHKQIVALNERIRFLESLPSGAASSCSEEAEMPDDFDQLEEWGKRHLAGKVILHNRAIREARKSKFEDVSLAYQALLLLRDYYVPMKREGGLEKRNAYEKALSELGLEDTPPTTERTAGEAGKTYYRNFAGRDRFLERHLKGNNNRDERYGFRLYFFWDDDSEQVVVGHLPSHLYHPKLS